MGGRSASVVLGLVFGLVTAGMTSASAADPLVSAGKEVAFCFSTADPHPFGFVPIAVRWIATPLGEPGRDLSESDLRRLVAAQNAAREGSLDALEGRTKRMLAQSRGTRASLDHDRRHSDHMLTEDGFAPPRRQLTMPERATSQRSYSPPRRSRTLPIDTGSLFCRYSERLQYSSAALDTAFDASGDGQCPFCRTAMPLFHEVIVPLGDRDYRVEDRFIIKSHTPDGRFACVLCSRHRDVDCVCRDVEALAKHLASMHTPDEARQEADLVELTDTIYRQRQIEYSRS